LRVPPKGYGGTELIVSLLTEELVNRGHEVTLFASGDSTTSAKLDSYFPEAIGNSGDIKNVPFLPLLHCSYCFEKAGDFDIIHNHAQYYAMFFSGLTKTPVVHTMHGSFSRGDVPEDSRMTLEHFKDQQFVSISNAQQEGMPDLNFVGTVYNGTPLESIPFSDKKEDYLLWIGRISRKKGPLEAIEVAKRSGKQLKMVAAVDSIEREFFEKEVQPLIDGEQITFHGEVSHEETVEYFKYASATLVPISWNEPFGLVMVESMASGTPVIAFNRGSVPEVVDDGVTGFIIDPEKEGKFAVSQTGIEGMVEAVKRIGEIAPRKCRERVELMFSVKAMVDGYEKVYETMLAKS